MCQRLCILLTVFFMLTAAEAMAQDVMVDPAAIPAVEDHISYIQTEWAVIKYQTAAKDDQIRAIEKLEAYAAKVIREFPDRAEPRIWAGIVMATGAGISGGLSALSKVKHAKALFEKAIQIDPNALSGSAYTSLGSLYYQVPGWPIGFGDKEKAEKYLTAALRINPEGIDPNYFYGDFLVHEGRLEEAIPVLQKALAAPDREGRSLADAGRRHEIKAAISQAEKDLSKNGKKRAYN